MRSGGATRRTSTYILYFAILCRSFLTWRFPVRPAEPLDPDYHESEDAFLLVYNLGRLSLEWNMLEHFFTVMIWEMLGDFPTGMAVTGGMGNQSKADVILKLAR